MENNALSLPDRRYRKAQPDLPRQRAKALITEVCERRGVGYRDVMSRTKNRRISAVRMEAYFVVWQELGWSLGKVGRAFGRDHSTVSYGIAKHLIGIGAEPCRIMNRVLRHNRKVSVR